jgi:deoxyribodipyrimidine photo-lyase
LANIPASLIHEPWKLSLIEQQLYQCEIGKEYPAPIVDIEASRKYASEIIWGFRKTDEVKTEGKRILNKHVTNPNSNKTINARSKKTKLT